VEKQYLELFFRRCSEGSCFDTLSEISCIQFQLVDSSWNVMAHGDAREGKWRGNWRMEWVASTLHTTSEHGVSSITTADAQTSAASSWLNWRPCRFKWTRPFRRKTKSSFCACAITFQLASTAAKLWNGRLGFHSGHCRNFYLLHSFYAGSGSHTSMAWASSAATFPGKNGCRCVKITDNNTHVGPKLTAPGVMPPPLIHFHAIMLN